MNQTVQHTALVLPVDGPARRYLETATYAQAVCWIGACLADALHYAHERGLVHLDIKPPNVLLAADGQPMLLDFHLARAPVLPDGPYPDWLGGTWTYMSPEQRDALLALRSDKPIPSIVDGRSDIYSLGLILYEMLGGMVPLRNPAQPQLAMFKLPGVTRGLHDLLYRCLAFSSESRYQTAAELATDLRLHASDLPLRGVRNRSVAERWQKWRRRRPQGLALALTTLAGCAALLAIVGLVRFHIDQRRHDVETAHAEANRYLEKGDYKEAAAVAQRGITLAESMMLESDANAFREQLQRARRCQTASELHDIAEQLRFYSAGPLATDLSTKTLEQNCQALWAARAQVVDVNRPDPAVIEDLLDVALLGAQLHINAASDPTSKARAVKEAAHMLAEAETLAGPSADLAAARRRLADIQGQPIMSESVAKPQLAPEFLALGRASLMAGEFDEASRLLQRAVDLRPDHFWSQFYLGRAAYQRQRFADGIAAFQACLALRPQCAEVRCHRALCLATLGRSEEAMHDYDRALELNPQLAMAAFNRGSLLVQADRRTEALADFRRALACGADPVVTNYNIAMIHYLNHDRAGAFAALEAALKLNANFRPARDLLDQVGKAHR